ncbi:hypothetical protein PoB_006349000 [Plakobranchus ocellatus]|uniref:Uncharacterized protein n=1 Tax=Plakobranchus ocellatus TaxID=259542 RepID=A0AAV4CYM4_9GAST|nr:hypothetical protein PoB_006349000 [Plakobranchus ocellatus]
MVAATTPESHTSAAGVSTTHLEEHCTCCLLVTNIDFEIPKQDRALISDSIDSINRITLVPTSQQDHAKSVSFVKEIKKEQRYETQLFNCTVQAEINLLSCAITDTKLYFNDIGE